MNACFRPSDYLERWQNPGLMIQRALQERVQHDLLASDSEQEELGHTTKEVRWSTLSQDERRNFDPRFRFDQTRQLVISLNYISDQLTQLIVSEQREIALEKKKAIGAERSRKNHERAKEILRERASKSWKERHPPHFQEPSPATASQLERLQCKLEEDDEDASLEGLNLDELEAQALQRDLGEDAGDNRGQQAMPPGSESSPVRVTLNVPAADVSQVVSLGAFYDPGIGWYVFTTNPQSFDQWVTNPHMP